MLIAVNGSLNTANSLQHAAISIQQTAVSWWREKRKGGITPLLIELTNKYEQQKILFAVSSVLTADLPLAEC